MAPMTRPSGLRKAEAFSVVGMTSPAALQGFQRGRDHFAAGAARVEPGIARDALRDYLSQRRRELAGLLRADEAGQRLLDELVPAEPEEARHRVVSLEDLALQV